MAMIRMGDLVGESGGVGVVVLVFMAVLGNLGWVSL